MPVLPVTCAVQLKDKDRITQDDFIGKAVMDLRQVNAAELSGTPHQAGLFPYCSFVMNMLFLVCFVTFFLFSAVVCGLQHAY